MIWNHRCVKYKDDEEQIVYITEVYYEDGVASYWVDPIEFGSSGIWAEDLELMVSAINESVLVIDGRKIYEV